VPCWKDDGYSGQGHDTCGGTRSQIVRARAQRWEALRIVPYPPHGTEVISYAPAIAFSQHCCGD